MPKNKAILNLNADYTVVNFTPYPAADIVKFCNKIFQRSIDDSQVATLQFDLDN